MTEHNDPIVYLSLEKGEKDLIKCALEAASAVHARDNCPLPTLDPIFNLSTQEAAAFVRHCDSAMKSHASDMRHGHDKEAALSAFEHAVAILLEICPVYPAERANIDEVLRRHGHGGILAD